MQPLFASVTVGLQTFSQDIYVSSALESTSLRALTLPLNSPGTFIFLLGHLDMARKCWYVDVFFLSLVYDDVRLAVVAQLFGCVAFLLGRYHLF